MKVLALATLAAAAMALANGVDKSEFRFTRDLAAEAGAPVRFEPDGPMYAHARADFADLRVLDSAGEQVPWRTEPVPAAIAPERVALVARGRLGGVQSVVVDRGPAPKVIDRIELDVPDSIFVGSVEVSGSATGEEGSYATLSTTQIYSVQGEVAARSTTAVFPATDYRYLLLRARGVTDITGATVARDPEQVPLEPLSASVSVRQGEGGATIAQLDLGHRDVPSDAIEVRSASGQFVRQVVVEGSNGGGSFVPIGSGKVARFQGVDLDRIAIDGQQRYVRVTIRNGDDAPLESLGVEVLARPRPLLLADGFAPPFRLYYGAAAVAAPAYDFALLPPASTVEQAVTGELGAEARNDLFEAPADARTFFDRNGGAITALLVVAAIVVAAGGVLALRRRPESRR